MTVNVSYIGLKMNKRILWRSWSPLEAIFELDKFKSLPMKNTWVNGRKILPKSNDIYLTANGFDYRYGLFRKLTLYAESYNYLKHEYVNYDRNAIRWDHRFHFNPVYAAKVRSSQQGIGCFWESEIPMYDEIYKKKEPKFTFGMVLGNKGSVPQHEADFGPFRSKIVLHARGRSWKYWGTKWPDDNPHYGGETYVNGHRTTPIKFNDARILLKNAKFVFAVENCYHSQYSLNYLTEKIFHGFLSGSVPVYAGCWNVESLINPNLFLDIRKFDFDVKKILNYCENMPDNEYNGYRDRIHEFIHGSGREFSCDKRFLQLDDKIYRMFK